MTKRQFARIRFLRARRSYNTRELAVLLGVHLNTVLIWHKEGLQTIDEESCPLLFVGQVVRKFLNARRSKRKYKLSVDECYCAHCRCPRLPKVQPLRSERTGRKLGNGRELVFLRGECSECGCKMIKFDSWGSHTIHEQLPTETRPVARLEWPSTASVNSGTERTKNEHPN
jgi:hypothetical protein